MDSRSLEFAAEFCRLVGAADLLAYLGVPDDTDSAEARRKLKARRKYMQGMQGNPKYKQEALYLIKHFAALDAVLADPPAYLVDARRRAESVHIPILEMTVRGVLAGGSLSAEQEEYLRRNAVELGVTEPTFDELLERLTREAGVSRSRSKAVRAVSPAPAPQSTGDFYRVLDLTPAASAQEIEDAWRQKRSLLDKLSPSPQREELVLRTDLAWNVLKDRAAREQYDLSSSRTGPPARARVARPDQTATAPPVRPRAAGPNGGDESTPSHSGQATTSGTGGSGRPARLEVDDEPVRHVRVIGRPKTERIVIRNIGDGPMEGTATTDAVWMRVEPARLEPERREQTLEVVIDPATIPNDRAVGRVSITTDAGNASIEIQVRRTDPRLAAGATLAGLVAIFAVVSGVGWLLFQTMGPGSNGLTIRVDPGASDVRLDGRSIGKGSSFVIPEPPLGEVTLTVEHPNFQPWSKELVVERGRAQEIEARLELARPMTFVPAPGQRRGQLDQNAANDEVRAHGKAIEDCIRLGAKVGQILTGTFRVHVDKDGRGAGFEVQGTNVDDPAVQACLARQAAAITFAPLADGDFATVRYDYTVTPEPSTP